MCVILVFVIVLYTILIVSFVVNKYRSRSVYHICENWNRKIHDVTHTQDIIHDIGLPLSMQYASKCNLVSAVRLDRLIVQQHDQILKEVRDLIHRGYKGLPMKDIDDVQYKWFENQPDWTTIWVKFVDKEAGTAIYLPTLRDIVRKMGDDVSLLQVSIFWPGVSLPAHRGISKSFYRYHYGLDIPEGDTGMIIDNTYFKWKNRQGVIWNDTLVHSAWNKSSEVRLIVFADLKRSLPRNLIAQNNRVYKLIQQSKIRQENSGSTGQRRYTYRLSFF